MREGDKAAKPWNAMVTALPGGIQIRGVTSVEEGLDVERVTVARNDVEKDTMSAMVKLAKKICGFCDVGQSTAACQLMVLPSRKQLVTRGVLRPAQGGAKDTEERVYGLVSLTTSSRDEHDKLWRAMLSCSLAADCEGWFLGEVDALDSHEKGCGDLRKSQRLRRLPREACYD